MRRRKLFGAFSILAVASTLVVVGATSGLDPASAWVGPNTTTSAGPTLSCLAESPIGDQTASQSLTIDTTAPMKVEKFDVVLNNETFQSTSQPQAGTLPSDLGSGATANNFRDFRVRIPVPTGATRISEEIVAGTGSNYGPGTPTITYNGGFNRWELVVPGPINPGAFQLPAIRTTVQATGTAGSDIQPKIGGSSKTDWGFSLIVNATLPFFGATDLPTFCWPTGVNPALSTTRILPVDTTGPVITVTTPANGGTYAQNALIGAAYGCDDGVNGTGHATCAGTVINGAPFDTSTVGPHSFTVNASDNKGNLSTQTVNYTVVDQPGLSVRPTWAFEGSPAGFSIVLSKPWPLPVSVQYQTVNGSAIAGTDYTTTSGTANFAPGVLSFPVNVSTTNDNVYQGEVQFALNLLNPVNAILSDTSANARILDNDTPPPAAAGKTVTEGPGVSVAFDVSIPFDPGVPVNVSYQTADGDAIVGNDYTNTFGTLIFNPGGPLTQTVSVPVIDDPQDDGYAIDFSLLVTNVSSGEAGQTGLAVILDNDGPAPTAAPIGAKLGDNLVVEGDNTTRNAWVMVRLDKPVTSTVSFSYTTADGSATAASKDYKAESGTLTFQPGQTTRAISLGILPDTTNEGDEQFVVNLTFVGGGNPIGDAQGVVTIQDDDNPTAPDYVVSVGDAQMWEGNADLGQVDLPVTINKKRPKDAPDEDIEVQLDIAYGTATATDVYVKDLTDTVVFPGGVNKNVQIKVRGDTAVEPDEELTVTASPTINTPGSVSFGRPVGTLTIRNDDGAPTAPVSVVAQTSATKLGYVDLSWGVPVSGEPTTSYEWRVATDSSLDTEPWASTNTGLNRNLEHDCGEGVTCLYQVRALNFAGTSPGSAIVPGTGLEDLAAPDLLVFTPKQGANLEDYAAVTYNGLIGTAFGDDAAATVKVYPCASCTNVPAVQTLPATVLGAGWSASGPALPAGSYTVEVTQTDWAGNSTSVMRSIQTRSAVFVSATGSDAAAGTSTAPKLTINAGLATAAGGGRAEVVVGQGVYGAASVTATHNNKAVRGGFDQYAGWARPGSAGLPGTPSQTLTSVEAGGTAILATAATGITLESLQARGLATGQPAGSSLYSIRAITGSNLALQNVKTQTDQAVQGGVGSTGTTGANGGNGTNGFTGSAGCADNSGAGSGFAGNGGGGAGGNGRDGGGRAGLADVTSGRGACNTGTGGTGNAGLLAPPAGGGAGGGGGVSETDIFICVFGQNTSTGGGGGQPGAGGGAAQAGHGGGAGGGGGGGMAACFAGQDRGAGGGGGGGGANPGTSGGTSVSAGGNSYGVFVDASTVTIDALSVINAGNGGQGGTGGTGGTGGAGGQGRDGGAGFGDSSGGGGGAGGGGGGGGAGGQGATGGRSIAVLHQGSGSVTVAGSAAAGLPGTGGTGGAGGTAGAGGTGGAGGIDGADPFGQPGTAGSPGSAGSAGVQGPTGPTGLASCSTFIGGICTP